MRHRDIHRERDPSGMDGRVAETFVILRIFSPQLLFPGTEICIYIKLSRWRTTQKWLKREVSMGVKMPKRERKEEWNRFEYSRHAYASLGYF